MNDDDDVLRVPVVKSVSPCKSAIETARRKERERIIGWLSDDDLDAKITIRKVIDVIRSIPKEMNDDALQEAGDEA